MVRVMILGVCLATPRGAIADGGALRISETRGDVRITVFTSPTPLVVGSADVSVLVLDSQSGQPRVDLPIRVTARRKASLGDGAVAGRRSALATSEAATNKLMRAASVTFAESGTWEIEVVVDVLEPLRFDIEVGEPPPPWREMSLWIGWPLLVVAAFAIRQLAAARRSSPPASARTSA